MGSILAVLFFVMSPFLLLALAVYIFFLRRKEDALQVQQYIEKPRNLTLAIAFLIITLNIFAYDVSLGFGVSAFSASVVVACFALVDRPKRTTLVYVVLMVGVLSSLALSFRANGFVLAIDAVVVIFSCGFLILANSVPRIVWSGIWFLRTLYDFFVRLLLNIPTLLAGTKDGTRSLKIFSIVKTVSISLLVFLVFAQLLSSADPIFADLIKTLQEQVFARVFLSVFLTIVFAVVAVVALPSKDDTRDPLRIITVQDLFVPMAIVVFLIGIFLFIQIKYLFGTHADFSTFGLTYSEYVRKGFIELIIASAIGSVLSYGAILKTQGMQHSQKLKGLQVINVVMITELFMLLVSAFKRDLLYFDVYGLTRTRLIGGLFLFWLAGLLTMLLLLLLRKKIMERHLFLVMGVLSICFVAGLNVVNVDKVIAQNYRPSDFNNEIDYYYANQLSEDAIDGWQASVVYAKTLWQDLSQHTTLTESQRKKYVNIKLALITLVEKRDNLTITYGSEDEARYVIGYNNIDEFPDDVIQNRKFLSRNVSELHAYGLMQQQKTLFYDDVNCLLSDMFAFEIENSITTYDDEFYEMYSTERPFVNVANRYYPVQKTNYEQYPDPFYQPISVSENLTKFLRDHRIPTTCSTASLD